MSLRAVLLAVLLLIPCTAPCAVAAQESATAAWVPTAPREVRTHHEVRRGGLIAGAALFAAGYLGAAAWGTYYLASLQLGVLGCNDLYGGFQFLPLAGPLIGMFAGGACVPDSLHVEEALMPFVLAVPQLAGLIALIVGAVGHDVPDLPVLGLQLNGNGGSLSIGGSF